jgi:hypothetical protein
MWTQGQGEPPWAQVQAEGKLPWAQVQAEGELAWAQVQATTWMRAQEWRPSSAPRCRRQARRGPSRAPALPPETARRRALRNRRRSASSSSIDRRPRQSTTCPGSGHRRRRSERRDSGPGQGPPAKSRAVRASAGESPPRPGTGRERDTRSVGRRGPAPTLGAAAQGRGRGRGRTYSKRSASPARIVPERARLP